MGGRFRPDGAADFTGMRILPRRVSVDLIQQQLGHRDSRTILTTGAYLLADQLPAAAQAIADALFWGQSVSIGVTMLSRLR